MKKIGTLILLLVSAAFLLSGCGGGGGGGTPTPTPDPTPSPTQTTLTTTVELSDGSVAASLRSLSRAAYQSAVVTLTLADGTTYQMSDNGNGEYSLTVDNFPTGTPFIIEAKAGDLVLKNFFTDLAEAPDGDLGATNPETTLYTDIVAAYVEALDANNNFPTAGNLLAAVQGATIDIDLVSLKEQVLDDNDATYAVVRETYSTVLSVDNTANGTDSQTVLAADTTVTEVVTEIEQGGIKPPAGSSDAEAALLLAEQVISRYVDGTLVDNSALLGETADGFLFDGMNKEQFLASLPADDEYGISSLVSDLVLSQTSTVVASANAGEFLIYHAGTLTGTDPDTGGKFYDAWDDRYEGGIPLRVKKNADGNLVFMGNRSRIAGLDYELNYFKLVNDPSLASANLQTEALWLSLEESANFPIASVAVTSTAFSGTVNLAVFNNGDSNEWQAWLDTSQSTYWDGTGSYAIDWTGPIAGADLTFTITYLDGSVRSIDRTTATSVTPAYPEISAIGVNADGTVDISFSNISGALPGGAPVAWMSASIIDDNGTWIRVAEQDLDLTTTSVTVPNGILTPGTVYKAQIEMHDIYNRLYAYEKYFEYSPGAGAALGFNDALLDGKVFLQTWTPDVGGLSQETLLFTSNGSGYDIHIIDEDYDSGGALIANGTGVMTAIIEADGSMRVDWGEVDPDTGASQSVVTLLAEDATTITVTNSERTADDTEVWSDTETWKKIASPIDFTDALLDGNAFLQSWDVGGGGYGEGTYAFTNNAGTYTLDITDNEYDAGGNLTFTETFALPGSIQVDGTLLVDFGGTDPDTGATHSVVTLLGETDTAVIIYTEDRTVDETVVKSFSEVWEKL